MTKAKYQKGEVIRDIGYLAQLLEEGECVYQRDKVQNRGWIQNQQFGYVVMQCKSGFIRRAIRTDS